MHMNRSWRRRLWWQHLWFVLLFALTIGLLAWLSVRYTWQADWTASGRNSLSANSKKVLDSLEVMPRISVYLQANSPQRPGMLRLLERYQRYRPDLSVQIINPDLVPAQVRERGIQRDGALFVEYGGRSATLATANEVTLTQTLQRLRREPHTVFFLDGHGERKAHGIANHDLGSFGRALAKLGIHAQLTSASIPTTVSTLVIASPQTAISTEEMRNILDYVRNGGDLLWLLEPGDAARWSALATWLGITIAPGMVLDAQLQQPALLVIADYAPHPITATLRNPSLLPQTAALEVATDSAWQATALLLMPDSSWLETAPLEVTPHFNPAAGERSGACTVGLALSRPHPNGSGEQRVVVLGDGDFLSNTYLGNGANLQLGLNIFHWLLHDAAALDAAPLTTADPRLQLSQTVLAWLAMWFLLVLPASLFSTGWLIWLHRRRQ